MLNSQEVPETEDAGSKNARTQIWLEGIGVSWKDWIRNEYARWGLGVEDIRNNMKEHRFGLPLLRL